MSEKKNIRGSILLWSLFFMVFLLMSFLYVNLKIRTQLESSAFELQGKKEILYIPMFDNTQSHWLIKNDEVLLITFQEKNTGLLKVIYGGPVVYSTGGTSTGYLQTQSHMVSFNSGDILTMQSLLGNAKISLEFASGTGLVLPYNYEIVKKNIGGNYVTRTILKKDQ